MRNSSPFNLTGPLFVVGLASLAVVTGCYHGAGARGSSATESTSTTTSSSTDLTEAGTVAGSDATDATLSVGSSTTGDDSTMTASSTVSTTSGTMTGGTTTGMTTAAGVCGDGLVDEGEECDDGDDNADGGPCTSTCTMASCGDGLMQPTNDEECDDGSGNGATAACTDACKAASCGDGFVWEDVEECDLGEDNEAGVYGGCTPMSCTFEPHCGDGELQKEHEECDLGEEVNGLDGEACAKSCKFNGKVIFATSKTYVGDLGGIAGADDKCNTLAMEATLANAGNFMAWLSTDDTSPAARMTPHDLPYVLTDGTTVIAESWADLIDGSLAAKIDRTEAGTVIANGGWAWTGTTAKGEPSVPSCEGWTSAGKSHFGHQGSLFAVDDQWSSAKIKGCQYPARLICIEQ